MEKKRKSRKWNAENRNTILEFVLMGYHREIAAARAKVSTTAIGEWLSRGEVESKARDEYLESGGDPDDPEAPQHTDFAEFYEDYYNAEAQAQITLAKPIIESENIDHRMWVLERRFPNQWGIRGRQQVEISGPGGKPIELADARKALFLKLDGMMDREDG